MDIPSLFMIPSAVSSGKVHSVFPNSTDADFDFNRDSSATRVNSQGLIEEVGYFGSELVSGDNANFNSSTGNWQQFRGVLSWDSYLQAGKWTDNNTSGGPVGFTMSGGVIPTLASKTYIIEFKAKTDSNNSFNFSFIGESSTFNAISNPNLTSDFQDYKFTFVTSTANQRLYVGFSGSPLDNGESYFIDNVSVKELIGDRARLNYEIEGGLVNTKPSLLLEPQSTNLIKYSNDFTQSEWNKISGATVDANVIISPDGTLNASRLNFDTVVGSRMEDQIAGASSGDYSFAVYLKADEPKTVGIRTGFAGTSTVNVNVTTEWQRFSITQNNPTNPANGYAQIRSIDTSGGSVYVWGAQIEQLSYSTSLIPTNGSTQTRAAETCNGAGTSSILPNEGILYFEFKDIGLTHPNQSSISISGSNSNNRILIYRGSGGAVWQLQIKAGGSTILNTDLGLSGADSIANYNKVAVRYKSGSNRRYVNGTRISANGSVETTTFTLSDDIQKIQFLPDASASSNQGYGKFRDIRVYNTKEMTDSEVDILLTKITS